MSAGAPHGTHDATSVAHTRTQEAHIRHLIGKGNTPATIAAAVGCTIARVTQVATDGIPAPRQPVQAAPLPIPDLLAVGHAHDNPNINRLTHRIVADLKLLRQAVDTDTARADAARGQHQHRRRTDTTEVTR